MISKELLSEVLGEKVIDIQELNSEAVFGGKQLWVASKSFDCAANIYELQAKCKEWALKQGYPLLSALNSFTSPHKKAICVNEEHVIVREADTEPEAIFKACEDIIKKINK